MKLARILLLGACLGTLIGCGDAGSSPGAGDFQPTGLPLEADVRIAKDGGYSETMTNEGLRPTCSGISVNSLLLEQHEIELKSQEISSDCLIKTQAYGDLLLKINQVAYSYAILLTPKQQQLFERLREGD